MSVSQHLQLLAQETAVAADLARGEQDVESLLALIGRLSQISEQVSRARRVTLLELDACAGEQPAYTATVGP